MKKSVLLSMVLLAIVGMAFSQDVYYSGYQVISGIYSATVYKNGEELFHVPVGPDLVRSTSNFVVVDESSGDYYWISNTSNFTSSVFKNQDNYLTLDGEVGLTALALKENDGGDLYSAGLVFEGGVERAAYWINNDPTPHCLGDGSYDSEIKGAYYYAPGKTMFFCGTQHTSKGLDGKVWLETFQEVLTIPNMILYDVAYYNGAIYTVGLSASDKAMVFRNEELLYNLGSSTYSYKLVIEGGDIYAVGYNGNSCMVWKNGEVLYDHPLGSSSYFFDVDVNSQGVYYVGNSMDDNSVDHGVLYKDGELIYTTDDNGHVFNSIYVTRPEKADTIRTLPYFEDFETGETDWDNWIKIDWDDNNYYSGRFYASYWDRGGLCNKLNEMEPYSGDHVATHRFLEDEGVYQQGILITPRLFLQPNRDLTELRFYSYTGWPDYYYYEGVWISYDSDPYDLNAYHEVWSPNDVSASWEEVAIDLSAFQGYPVYIAFVYGGENAHTWSIDDVSVVEDWSPCPPISVFPYMEDFNNGVPDCWYNLDYDHTYPNWNMTGGYANHTWGSQEDLQIDLLFTPYFQLPEDKSYKLTFESYFESSSSDMMSQVGISVDETGIPDPYDFDVIWEDDFLLESETRTVSIDLSEYAGHTVCIAFGYKGTYAHFWRIDDLSITESPMFTVTATAFPENSGSVEGVGTYPEGRTVTLYANPNPGFEFDHWNDGNKDNPRKVTVTEDLSLQAFFIGTSIDEYSDTKLILSPNPVKDNLRIEGVTIHDAVEIYNSLGVLVKTGKVNNDHEIGLEDLAPGLYMIRCGNMTARFIKN